MVVGGVAYRTRRYEDISDAIDGIKGAANIKSEMKWSKFRGGERTKAYKAVIDLFYALVEQRQMHFHCIIAEFGKFSHRAFEGGDPETSVNRMYFQLLVHRVCKFYAGKCYIYVYPDKGNDSKDLLKYLGGINSVANKKYGVEHRVVTIEPTDSSRCNILQMVDIIIGGIAYSCNSASDQNDSDSPKADLAKYVLEMSKRPTWLKNTGPAVRHLTVWNFRHQNLAAAGRAPQGARRYIRQG